MGSQAMKKKQNIIFVLAFIILFILIGVHYLNNYFKDNNIFLYATGSNDKAFLNSTWKMSKNEVERANETILEYGASDDIEIESVFSCINSKSRVEGNLKKNTFSCYTDKVYLYRKVSDVRYYFFSNMLYEYNVTIPVYGYYDFTIILNNLKESFGNQCTENFSTNESSSDVQYYTCDWNTPKEKVSLSLTFPKNNFKQDTYYFQDKDQSSTVSIFVQNLQIYKTIVETIKKERSSNF
jgi:1,4-alpha-glucan branching enzyme